MKTRWISFSVALVTPGTAVPWFSTPTLARRCWIEAKKPTGRNEGPVYVGDSAVDHVTSQQKPLNPEDYWSLPMPDISGLDMAVDLADWFLDGDTGGDGLVGAYLPA